MSFKSSLLNTAAGLFIFCTIGLTAISILGVWDVLDGDVITKSFSTLGLLAVVAIIVIFAGRFIDSPTPEATIVAPHPLFHSLRNLTLTILIISAALLAFLGVLAIWEVIDDISTLYKSLSSLAILAFSSLIIVMVCLEREQNAFWQKRAREMTGGSILLGIILIWLLFAFIT